MLKVTDVGGKSLTSSSLRVNLPQRSTMWPYPKRTICRHRTISVVALMGIFTS
jgi:hypothetical protein